MEVFPVHQRRETFLRVFLHSFPDVEHRAACGVDQNAADFSKPLKVTYRDTESWQDNDVGRANRRKIECTVDLASKNCYSLFFETPIDVRIVDDFTHHEQPSCGKFFPRLIGVLDRPVHPVTEPEFL